MSTKLLPLQVRLRQLVRYEPKTGSVFWLERPASEFKSTARCEYWNNRYSGKEVGGISETRGYKSRSTTLRLSGGERISSVHRLVWMLFNGPIPEGMEIDHIDGNALNNKIENLRLVDHKQNVRNAALRKDNNSGRTGITKSGRKWKARGIYNKKYYNLGSYELYSDAVDARKKWEEDMGFHPNHGRASKDKL